jgi:peptidoglycan/xylan/chitin deacetylase (PgdA/CDA1 family)
MASYLQFIPLNWLIHLTGRKQILPFYHLVSDEEVIHIKHLYKPKTSKEFSEDLDFYLKNYKPVDFKGIRDSGEKNFLLTFDDGLAEFYHVVAPILLKKGIPAVCFLNPDFIDNKDLFYRYKTSILIEELRNRQRKRKISKEVEEWFKSYHLSLDNGYISLLSVSYLERKCLDELALMMEIDFAAYLEERKPYLTSSQVKELIDQGFHFGAHSMDHPRYMELNEETQLSQTRESMDIVQRQFSLPYRLFSFPFTDAGVSAHFFECIYDKKNPLAELTFGCAGLKKEESDMHFQRIPVEVNGVSSSSIIYGEYFYFMLKSVFNKNTVKRK